MKAPSDEAFNETEELRRYPKIQDYSRLHAGLPCLAFEKHDGTNLGWRWTNESFGPATFRSGRTAREEGGVFEDAERVFEETLRDRAASVLRGVEEAVFFAELRGERSFSGEHREDDPKRLHAIDVWIRGRGFMPPEEFARAFEVAPVYRGKLTAKFAEDVRAGRLGVNEGVVCKGGSWGAVWCCKIKTRAWLARGGEP